MFFFLSILDLIVLEIIIDYLNNYGRWINQFQLDFFIYINRVIYEFLGIMGCVYIVVDQFKYILGDL